MSDLFNKVGQRYKLLLITFAVILYAVPFVFFRGFGHAAAYIKYDGIDGESTDKGHEKWSDILSFGFGVSREKGKVFPKVEIDVTAASKPVDKSSPILMLQCATDSTLPSSFVEYTKDIQGRQQTYLKIEMSDVFISKYEFGKSSTAVGNDLVPVDAVSLDFQEVKMTYIPFDGNGEPLEPVVGVCRIGDPAGQ